MGTPLAEPPNVPVELAEAEAALRTAAYTTSEDDVVAAARALINHGEEEGMGSGERRKLWDALVAAVDAEPKPRTLIHSRASGMGADWDLDSALAFLAEADEIIWTVSLFNHNLAVRVGERVVCFDVPRPERAGA